MGVDIGSLESVVLRNVPPETANYVQRAGRAGRRNSSAALILTFARRRSHDLTFFAEPQKMIKGIIKAPYLTLDNEYLIKRHLQSVVMAYFFRMHKNYYGFSANSLINDGCDADEALYAMLQSKPSELLKSMKTILPEKAKGLFNLDSWEWSKTLVNNRQDTDALFDNAVRAYKEELIELESLIERYVKEQKFGGAEYAKGLVRSHKDQELIGFLSLYGIVPRYGFPVDVVPLKIKDHSLEAKRIDLSRDLRMAITDMVLIQRL
jgi:superfamily II DNA/RNA helicase